MSRSRLTFSARDVRAAIQLAEQTTGRAVIKVEIGNDGRIIVELAPPGGTQTAPAQDANPIDEVPGYGKAK